MPLASNLNWVPGSPATPNKVDVKLAADGSINLYNSAGTVSVLADVVGYYADHNHDDRYYTKPQSDTQLATKANASDVYTKAQINGLPSSSVVAGGAVSSAGTVSSSAPRFGVAWTVSKVGTGAYSVAMPGLNPGCLSPLLPLMIVSGLDFGGGSQQHVGFGSVSCGPGDTSVQINTYNVAGTATDRGFQFIAYRPGNGQLLPISAFAGATECTAHPDGTVECV